MAPSQSFTGQTADETRIRSGFKTAVMLGNYKGVFAGPYSAPTSVRFGALLRDGQTVGEITPEAINERKVNEFGYTEAEISDGVRAASFAITFQGNAREAIWAMQGRNGEASVAYDPSVRVTNFGFIHLMSKNEAGTMESSDLLLDVSCKEAPIPGTEAGGETTQTVNLYANEYIAGVLKPGHIWQTEFWYNNAAIANANSPDGIRTTFTLGLGNGSSLVYAANDAKVIDAAATVTWKKYIKMIKVCAPGGEPRTLADSEVSGFDVATGILTLVTVLADSTVLCVVWASTTDNALAWYDAGPYMSWRDWYGF